MRSVVVGAGIAGLALAVELRRLGWEVTVVEARYPGAGNSTRNVGRVRRMQLTADLTEFACRASDKWSTVAELTGGRNPLLYPTRYVWVLYDDAEREVVEPLQPMWREHDARARVVGGATSSTPFRCSAAASSRWAAWSAMPRWCTTMPLSTPTSCSPASGACASRPAR